MTNARADEQQPTVLTKWDRLEIAKNVAESDRIFTTAAEVESISMNQPEVVREMWGSNGMIILAAIEDYTGDRYTDDR